MPTVWSPSFSYLQDHDSCERTWDDLRDIIIADHDCRPWRDTKKYEKSPGLYCDHIGEAQLYDTEWKLLTYVDLQEADRNLETVVKYAKFLRNFV